MTTKKNTPAGRWLSSRLQSIMRIWRDRRSQPGCSHAHSEQQWRFLAQQSLSTPSRLLRRHGEIANAPDCWPVSIHHGWWSPILPDLDDLDLQIVHGNPEHPERHRYLIEAREMMESADTPDMRREKLRSSLDHPALAEDVRQHGGKQATLDRYFPPFINTIKGLPTTAVLQLWDKEWMTPMALSAASDADLRKIKGIGPVKLAAIRSACVAALHGSCEYMDRTHGPDKEPKVLPDLE